MNSAADKITESELEVMKVVWSRGAPITYAEIRDGLSQSGWASDTIHTLVRRLHQKGVLERRKEAVYCYTPLVSEKEYTDAKTRSFVSKVYGGDVKGLLSALLDYDSVRQEDLEELKSYWRRKKDE